MLFMICKYAIEIPIMKNLVVRLIIFSGQVEIKKT